MLQSLATGLASAVSVPASPLRELEQEAVGSTDSPPGLLDEHRRRMLGVLAEQIVPGSTEAGVVDLLDRVMAVEPAEDRRRFLSALGAFDWEARERYARGFLELEALRQLEILDSASTMAPARPVPRAWTKGQRVEPEPAGPPPPANLRDHFDHLRALSVRAFSATEAGMKELGFAGRMAFSSFPGCTHPGDEHH